VVLSRVGCDGRDEGFRPFVEVAAVAVEEDCEDVVTCGSKDAENLLAGEQLPMQVSALVRGLGPADFELVHAHEGGASG
jgi:hypothetical protein